MYKSSKQEIKEYFGAVKSNTGNHFFLKTSFSKTRVFFIRTYRHKANDIRVSWGFNDSGRILIIQGIERNRKVHDFLKVYNTDCDTGSGNYVYFEANCEDPVDPCIGLVNKCLLTLDTPKKLRTLANFGYGIARDIATSLKEGTVDSSSVRESESKIEKLVENEGAMKLLEVICSVLEKNNLIVSQHERGKLLLVY